MSRHVNTHTAPQGAPEKNSHMTTALLPNFFAGRWQTGTGAGTPMFDPVLGTELARVSSSGIDLAEGFAFAREQGGGGFGLDGVREFLEWDGHGMMARLRAVRRCGAFLVSVRVTGAEGSAWMLCAAR